VPSRVVYSSPTTGLKAGRPFWSIFRGTQVYL
jgi:hypothetical protein